MMSEHVRRAKSWFAQADSDARTATALLQAPSPMEARDVGCHIAALCSQAVEKSIKGYVVLNGQTPKMSHRADKYLVPLLRGDPLLRYHEHRSELSRLFDASTKGTIGRLLDLTPGTLEDKDVPNTEYPWTDADGPRSPAGAREFSDDETLTGWVSVARRVSARLHQLGIAVERRPG